jgi:DNA-binding transcriptional MocR family regulator
MTNTAHLPPALARDSGESLVQQIVRSVETRIEDRLLRAGVRMPSIRQYAEQHAVSRFTVVEAYDRLVAKGCLESRRGSGFYVRERLPLITAPVREKSSSQIDVVWLIRNMFREHPYNKMPGAGLLPPDWLDPDLIANALRAISRQVGLVHYGTPQGYLPLRQQLQLKLAELEIAAAPEQIVTSVGVTQALNLVVQVCVQPGDTVFVDDPAWFHMFASFTTLGANVVGITRTADGPDIAQMAELAAIHRPKLYVTNSVLHNPTSTSLSAAKAFQVLKLAEQFDFLIVEDDIYCDMHPGSSVQPAMRISALDQLNRTIYLGGFSKTLSANLRVGFIACSHEMAKRLADQKMLATLTSSDIGERVVYKVLSEGHYRKHADRIRGKLDSVRDKTLRGLERIGMQFNATGNAGMFVWAETGLDTNVLAQKGMDQGYVFAPGSLFSPRQQPSTRMRLNVACLADPGVMRFLEKALNEA